MKRKLILVILLFPCTISFSQKKPLSQKVDSILLLMTLDEKIGQLNQYSSDFAATGPITQDGDKQNQIRLGMIGSFLNVTGANRTKTLQQIAMQSRLKIPLLFGQDVLHGYRTTFPIPIAEACSWDLQAIEKSARVAATEASANGIHWIFAPMIDIGRDPRWGRNMEGAGEDTYLGSQIAVARVKGFQGKKLGDNNSVMACVKHFTAYGAAIGGRDYNSVDMSLRQLNETYLPPFKAAVNAGVSTVMNSFNDLNGVPATGNKYLQRDVLKKQWGFKGFVVSDWGSVGEMLNHGNVKDSADAAFTALTAGCDMDMESRCYKNNLKTLVQSGKLKIDIINDAVKRILTKKFELGLFDNPFKYCNEKRELAQYNKQENIEASYDIAKKSIVLLKNNSIEIGYNNQLPLLPLKKIDNNENTFQNYYSYIYNLRDSRNLNIALIGPLVKSVKEHLGFWSFDWDDDTARMPTLYDAIKKRTDKDGSLSLLYAKGCEIEGNNKNQFEEAIATANKSDIVVLYVGESRSMSGEARSKSNLQLPGVQEDLIKAIATTGKPIIVIIGAGRPLVFNWTAEHVPAILYTWWLGTKGNEAIANVLFGDYNPSGKLVMSFPRSEGQIPIYYNHYNTGRPAANDSDMIYVSAYNDLLNSPQYCFGYGKSYTNFKYQNLTLNKKNAKGNNDKIIASINITNSGNYDGEEVVQLYIRDLVGSVVRPIKELKGFQKIFFKKGETKTLSFEITTEILKFYNDNLQYNWEEGEFEIMIGTNSNEVSREKIYWRK